MYYYNLVATLSPTNSYVTVDNCTHVDTTLFTENDLRKE
jgi:hypothetical protein